MENWGRWAWGGAALLIIIVSEILDIAWVSAIINGLQFGSVFALVALGVALVYKATKVLNFAQGEVGTISAWAVWLILVGFSVSDDVDATAAGLPKLLFATVIAIIVGAIVSILINMVVVQRLAQASPAIALVATAGVMLLLTAVQLVTFEAKTRAFPRFISGAPRGLDLGPLCLAQPPAGVTAVEGECIGQLSIGGLSINWHMIIVISVLAVTAAALAAFFRTPPGVALLATAQDPFAAEIQGVSVKGMSALAWGLGGALAALGGILGAGVFVQIAPGLMTTTFLIPALVGAVLGGLTSMPGAVLGSILLGIAVAFTTEVVQTLDIALPGPPEVATFIVLVLTLVFRPRGLFGSEA